MGLTRVTARQRGTLRIVPNAPAAADALANLIVERARAACEARGTFAIALAGGTTPAAAYALLAQAPRCHAVDWSSTHVFFGDERCVPPDDAQSNYRMAREALLAHVPIPETHVHRMRGEDDPVAAALAYAQLLREQLGPLPVFDLVLLGLGADAHTASLFPGTSPFLNHEAFVRAVYVDSLRAHRITLTPYVINAARAVVFAVEGASKAQALARVRDGAYDPIDAPAQSIAPTTHDLTWLADEAAATLTTP